MEATQTFPTTTPAPAPPTEQDETAQAFAALPDDPVALGKLLLLEARGLREAAEDGFEGLTEAVETKIGQWRLNDEQFARVCALIEAAGELARTLEQHPEFRPGRQHPNAVLAGKHATAYIVAVQALANEMREFLTPDPDEEEAPHA